MNGSTEQIAGAVFRAITRHGHEEVEQAAINAYADVDEDARSDREGLSRTMFAELLDALAHHLDSDEQVEVLTAAIEGLVNRFGTVIDAAPVAICAVDADGVVQLWNPAAERTLGYDQSVILGRPFETTWADDDETISLSACLERIRAGERLTGIETRHHRPDGSLLDTQVWAAPLDDDTQNAMFVVVDVTERHARQERLSVLNRVLRHNIRNDLNVAIGHLDRLAEQLPADDPSLRLVRERLDSILELSDTARRIERVADADRTDAISFDLATVLADCIDRLRQDVPAAEVCATLPDRLAVVGHELLPYAFENVLENAVEHNDAAEPTVSVELTQPPDGDRAAVRITDNGPGLPPVERQVLQTTEETQLTHSTGLGLWLTNWIVRKSSGRVDVDCSASGTTVVIELPTETGHSSTTT
ncbi:PAS domain S-box protein [Haloplanus sp. C73]|uniref:PAS domain S-box protein n=1 Tax=Haloplanus sp. C73 TaxID=3421641 RepID=UPI003EB703C8